MAVSTEKLIPGLLPPKEGRLEDVDWSAIVDAFDPSTLSEKALFELARRNPYYTLAGVEEKCFVWEGKSYPIPGDTVDKRLEFAESCFKHGAEEMLNKRTYRERRAALITVIGLKAAAYYVKRQDQRMTEAEKIEEYQILAKWRAYCEERRIQEEAWADREIDDLTPDELEERLYGPVIPAGYTTNYNWRNDEMYIPILSVKIKMLRKAVGLTQKVFAKKIGYNVNKYPLLEQGRIRELGFESIEDAFPIDLVKRIVDLTYANPYWLESDDEDGDEGTAMTVDEAMDGEYMFADASVIRYWWSHR